VAEVEKRLLRQGAKRITALVEKDHPWATGFWEAVGFGRDQRIVRHVRTLGESSTAAHDRTERATMKILVNATIHLSEIRPSDKRAYVEHLNDKDIYDRTLRIPFPYTDTHADEWLALVEKSSKQHGQPVNWAIRNEADSMIGGIGFDSLALGKSHRAEIGYWLAKPYWGRGIMTAVVQRVCQHAFEGFGLAKITAHVFSHNPASARVLQKCGFREEGFLRKHFFKDGRFLDARLFALLR